MKIIKNVGLVLGVALSIFTISCAVLAWNPPSVQPTGGNVALPVNVGSGAQTKNGNLQINGRVGVGSSHSSFGLNVTSGTYSARFRVGSSGPYVYLGYQNYGIFGVGTRHYLSGDVGIGTSSPTQRLDVVGNARIRGDIVASGNITAKEPTAANHLTTKNYVDELFGNVVQEASSSNLTYVTGSNPGCPSDDDIMIMRRWNPATCQGQSYSWNCPGSSCTTPIEWVSGGIIPTCSYYSTGYPSCYITNYTCKAQTWSEVICAKIGEPLYGSIHTVDQCELLNGEVVSDGTNSFCRFDSGTCPTDSAWTQYKNWSTTIPATASLPDLGGPVYTGSHDWSNTPRESFYCFYSNSGKYCVVGYNYGHGGETVYATITQIGCY